MQIKVEAEGFVGIAEWDEEYQIWEGHVLDVPKGSIKFRSEYTDDLPQAMLDAIAEREANKWIEASALRLGGVGKS